MPPEIQNGLIAFVVVALGYLGGWLQNRMQRNKQQTEFERQKAQIEADAEAQNAKNQEAIRYTLTNYVNQIGRLDTDLREMRLNLSATQGALNSANSKLDTAAAAVRELKLQNEAQKTELDIFRENLGAAEQTIKELGDELLKKSVESKERDTLIAELKRDQLSMKASLDAVLKERDELKGQIKLRDEMHTQELAQRDEKIELMQARLDKLEKKETDELDASKVPATDPKDAPHETP